MTARRRAPGAVAAGLALAVLLLPGAVLVPARAATPDGDKCDTGAWQELEAKYVKALQAGDYATLRALKAQKAALAGCPEPGQTPGASSSAGGPGAPPSGPGGGTAATAGAPAPGGGPAVAAPGAIPGTASGTAPGAAPGTAPGTAPGPAATPAGTDTASNEEWQKRQDLVRRLARERVVMDEATSTPMGGLWRNFWDSVKNNFTPVPVEPADLPPFDELVARGDPIATRLQGLLDEVGDGAPTPRQLDDLRGLARQAQSQHASSGAALVSAEVDAATLALAGQVVSQIGAAAGQAAAEAALIAHGVDPVTARIAVGAVYEGLQHHDEGITGVVVYGGIGAASNVAGGAVGDRVGAALGPATTLGGRVAAGAAQGGAGGVVGGIVSATGGAAVQGRAPTAGEVVLGGTVGGIGGAIGGGIGGAATSPGGAAAGNAGDDLGRAVDGPGVAVDGPTAGAVDGPGTVVDGPTAGGSDGPGAVVDGPTTGAVDGPGDTAPAVDGPAAPASPEGSTPVDVDGPDTAGGPQGRDSTPPSGNDGPAAPVDPDGSAPSAQSSHSAPDPVLDAVRRQIQSDPQVADGHFIAMPESRVREALGTGMLQPTASGGSGSGFDVVYATNRGIPPAHSYPDGTHVVRIDAAAATPAARVDIASGQVFDGAGNPINVPPDSLVLIPGDAGSGQQVLHVRPDGRLATSVPSRFIQRWVPATGRFEPMG